MRPLLAVLAEPGALAWVVSIGVVVIGLGWVVAAVTDAVDRSMKDRDDTARRTRRVPRNSVD